MRFVIFTLLALALTGCSVVIDSDSYRGGDAGTPDTGTPDTGTPDTGPTDSSMDAPPTGCTAPTDCGGATPICDFPRMICVQCIDDGHCPGLTNRCNMGTGMCEMFMDCPTPCGGGTVCLMGECRGCDEDRDGFFSTEPLCAALAPAGQPFDCDDGNDAVYPGAETICGDGVINDCDSTEVEFEEFASAIEGADEVGLIPPQFAANLEPEVVPMPLGVMGDPLAPGLGNWIGGYVGGRDAQLAVIKARSEGPIEGWVFDVIESSLSVDAPAWPFERVDSFDMRVVGGQPVFGVVGQGSGTALASVFSSDVGGPIYNLFTTDAVPTLDRPAVVGRVRDGVGVFSRGPFVGAGGVTGGLTAVVSETETTSVASSAVPEGDGFGMAPAGGFVVSEARDGNGILLWDGGAPMPRVLALPGSLTAGPPSLVVEGPIGAGGVLLYAIVPTTDGVAVVELRCERPTQDTCTPSLNIEGVPAEGLLDAQYLGPHIMVARMVKLPESSALNVSLLDTNATVVAEIEVLSSDDIGASIDEIIGLDTEMNDADGAREFVFGAATSSGFGSELYMGALRLCPAR